MDLLLIPGNIKQNFAPFVINPSAGINQAYSNSNSTAGVEPLKFSFNPYKIKDSEQAGLLNMCPSSIANNTQFFKNDLSFKNLKNIKSFNDFLNELPSVLIREYLPDTKLDQSLNFFNDIFSKVFKSKDFDNKSKAGDKTDEKEQKSTTLKDKLATVVDTVFNTIESEDWQKTVTGGKDADGNPGKSMDNKYSYIVKFPFFLYYKLQSCVTTNIYEIPCIPDGNMLYNSNGRPGWDKGNGMRLMPDFVKNIPILGKMLDTLLGNIGINFTPWWDASSGSNTLPNEITLKFSLFNDCATAAIANFIFVNTIIQNNMWLQYHIFLHSSSLYDVKIAGIGKQYACTGLFDVLYKGILRKPSSYLMTLLKSHVGPRYNNSIVKYDLIKIPDVYDVTMKFLSVLPQNFNTFIYNYMSTDLMNMTDAYQPSGFTNILDAMKLVQDKAVKAWEG